MCLKGYLYVANYYSNNVTVINGATNTAVVSSIAVGAFSTDIAYDTSNGYLYVTNAGSNNVTVINGGTNTVVVRSITVGNGPIGIAYDTIVRITNRTIPDTRARSPQLNAYAPKKILNPE